MRARLYVCDKEKLRRRISLPNAQRSPVLALGYCFDGPEKHKLGNPITPRIPSNLGSARVKSLNASSYARSLDRDAPKTSSLCNSASQSLTQVVCFWRLVTRYAVE
jgi:hypothetical protein